MANCRTSGRGLQLSFPPSATTIISARSRGRSIRYSQTRYAYGTDHNWTQNWTTVNNLSEETWVLSLLDGVSRERITISEHPTSQGGLKAAYRVFDVMGRVSEWSNVIEVNGSWAPYGDDAAGYPYSRQAFDWKGRPTITTNQDGTTKQVSYEGCGCAGSDVVTITDEGTLVSGTLKQRKQMIYRDVFGREVKSELYDWDNNVYATTTNVYNVRDQATTTTRQQGSGGASQVTTFGYDGHGRLSTRQFPNASGPSSFVYNADDTPQVETDARGASSTFGYNNRGLVTGITYGVPSGVAATPNVTFGYDENGNRTSMTDGLGSATYHYDSLSRMDWETRVLTGVGSFTINYGYNLAGQLTSVTDPANDNATYVYNRVSANRSLPSHSSI